MSKQRAIVAVLAGGRGSRLGGRKPAAMLAGRPLIHYPLSAAREAGLEAVVIAKPGDSLPALPELVVHEPESQHHPLCGLIAALTFAAERSSAPAVVAVACDMPFLTAPLLRWLSELDEPAVVELDGSLQPLLACYKPMQVRVMERALYRQESLREAIASLAVQVVAERELAQFGDPRRLCFNVNSPEELRTAEKWLSAPETG